MARYLDFAVENVSTTCCIWKGGHKNSNGQI